MFSSGCAIKAWPFFLVCVFSSSWGRGLEPVGAATKT